MTLTDFKIKLNTAELLVRDGISFHNIMYIDLLTNHKSIFQQHDFQDSFIYYNELKRSLKGDGRYLIFTCACGIADDGGWDGVWVRHKNETIEWTIEELNISYIFTREQYEREIAVVELEIEQHSKCFTLESRDVIFPELW